MARWERFVYGSDQHGDHQDPGANKAFFNFLEDFKPKHRICGGDLFDMRPLRRKASEVERRESMRDDFEAGKFWLEKFKATNYLRGNHCERLYDLSVMGLGPLSDYAILATNEIEKLVRSLRCKMQAYDKRDGVLRLGNLRFIHGYSSGIYAARVAALVYGDVVMGHVHQINQYTIPAHPSPKIGMACGCLCKLDLDYNRSTMSTLAQQHGWSYGVVNPATGSFRVWQASKVDGVWLIPSDI